MGRAGSRRDRWLLGLKLVAASAAFGIAGEGCGAATDITDLGDFGTSLGGTTNGTGGQGYGGETIIAICGNGQLDQGEACEGQIFRGQTCASATSGARTLGFLSCTSNCQLDYSNCSGAGTGGFFIGGGGAVGAGGRFGTGGFVGGGGFGGFGGFFPDASVGAGGSLSEACYSEGGVPDPAGNGLCDFGDVAIKACFVDYDQRQGNAPGSCNEVCACQNCASTYDRCTALPGCLDFIRCANSYGCVNFVSCADASLCGGFLQGSITQTTASTVDGALGCVTSAGCCSTGLGPH